MPYNRYLAMPDSRRDAMPGATRAGPCDPNERMQEPAWAALDMWASRFPIRRSSDFVSPLVKPAILTRHGPSPTDGRPGTTRHATLDAQRAEGCRR